MTHKFLPKTADFPAWNDRIANALAPGSTAEHVRGYLKTTAERVWRLVNCLTHAAIATRVDAELALSATSRVIKNYALLIVRRKAATPDRCGRCQSYRVTVDWRPDLGSAGEYVVRCEFLRGGKTTDPAAAADTEAKSAHGW